MGKQLPWNYWTMEQVTTPGTGHIFLFQETTKQQQEAYCGEESSTGVVLGRALCLPTTPIFQNVGKHEKSLPLASIKCKKVVSEHSNPLRKGKEEN